MGGCEGNAFQFNDRNGFMSTVKEINTWNGGDADCFTAIQVILFNGQEFLTGQVPSRQPKSLTYTFKPGEHLVGDYKICTINNKASAFRFRTNKSDKPIEVGDLDPKRNCDDFPARDGYFSGIFGYSNNYIQQLGFSMTHKVTNSKLSNIKYPTIKDYKEGLAP